jgi:hypothetical protein
MRPKTFRRAVLVTVAAAFLSTLLYPATAVNATTRKAASKPLVSIGTQLRIRLNDTLSSKESRPGDRFTATVVNPTRYEEARVIRSGCATGERAGSARK